MGSCVCCACWACCAAAARIYPCTEEVSRLSAAQGADIPLSSPVSELSHRAGAGSQFPFAFLHAVQRCQRVVWDQVRILAVPCGVRAHPAGGGIPRGDQPLPGCLFVSAYLLLSPAGAAAQPLGDVCATG